MKKTAAIWGIYDLWCSAKIFNLVVYVQARDNEDDDNSYLDELQCSKGIISFCSVEEVACYSFIQVE